MLQQTKPIVLISALLVAFMIVQNTLALGFSIPKMVNTRKTTEKCCLPRKISLQGKTVQVSYAGNVTNTYFGSLSINNDLDNGKARTDLFNVNIAPNTTVISYRNGEMTYSYSIVWGQVCFCEKTTNADWSKNFCTEENLLEVSNIGFSKALKYGTDSTYSSNKRFYNANYYWAIPVDHESCIFVSSVEAIVNSEGSLSKNYQFYGANLQVDPKLFTIPDMCPPESQCKQSQ